MARITQEELVGVIHTDPLIDLTIFIDTASDVVDYIATQDDAAAIPLALFKRIELYLAAHFYAIKDQQVHSESTDGTSATYQGKTSEGFGATIWGAQALRMDVSGTLAAMDAGNFTPQLIWLGKPVSQQIPYQDRN